MGHKQKLFAESTSQTKLLQVLENDSETCSITARLSSVYEDKSFQFSSNEIRIGAKIFNVEGELTNAF